jgi:hypothetical protein
VITSVSNLPARVLTKDMADHLQQLLATQEELIKTQQQLLTAITALKDAKAAALNIYHGTPQEYLARATELVGKLNETLIQLK